MQTLEEEVNALIIYHHSPVFSSILYIYSITHLIFRMRSRGYLSRHTNSLQDYESQSPKMKKSQKKSNLDNRTQQEQIRKRRHNLFRRLKEFNDRYDIDIWMTMKMPSGRIYTFTTDPETGIPTEEEIVC
jgi:hypothetical protein